MSAKANSLRELLKGPQPVICCAMGQLRDPKLVEMIANSGNYQAIWFDQEHAGWTSKDIEDGTRAPGLRAYRPLSVSRSPIIRLRCVHWKPVRMASWHRWFVQLMRW